MAKWVLLDVKLTGVEKRILITYETQPTSHSTNIIG